MKLLACTANKLEYRILFEIIRTSHCEMQVDRMLHVLCIVYRLLIAVDHRTLLVSSIIVVLGLLHGLAVNWCITDFLRWCASLCSHIIGVLQESVLRPLNAEVSAGLITIVILSTIGRLRKSESDIGQHNRPMRYGDAIVLMRRSETKRKI